MASRTDYGKMIAAFFSGAAPTFGGAMLQKKRFQREQEAAQTAEESRRIWEEAMFGKRVEAEKGAAKERREFESAEAKKGREFTAGEAEQKFVREQDIRTQQAVQAFGERKEQTEHMNRLTEGYIYATHPQAVVTKPTGELDYEATVRNLTPDEYKDLLYIQARGVPAEPTRQWPRPEVDELLSSINTIQSILPYASPEQQKQLQTMLGPMLNQLAGMMGITLPTKTEGTEGTKTEVTPKLEDLFNVPHEARVGPTKTTGAIGDIWRKLSELYFSLPYYKSQTEREY